MFKGRCNCGEVEYQANCQSTDVYQCHCSICRSSTGSGGIAVMITPTVEFSWLKGEEFITYWRKPGHDWHTNFCKVCGSSLPGKNDEQTMYIPVGTLTEGHQNLKLAHHLFVGSKASWEEFNDTGKQHQAGYKS